MIAKRVPRRKDSKSSFSALAKYILRAAGEGKIEFSRVCNCGFDTPELAIKEIEATQSRNKRSKTDKTYHLMVSFPAGELPTKEQLEDIEDEICRAIGLGDHQRISAAHNDTDNFHIHIAINKIHPVSYRAIEPYYDKYSLDEACSRLEQKHGLRRDNRIDKSKSNDKVQGRAGDMEAHSGLDSFKRWLRNRKDDLEAALEKAETWDALHISLAKFNLEIRPRGAGLVISSKGQKVFVKASELGRQFGKGQLEEKLGKYQAPSEQAQSVKPEERYCKPPQQEGAERSELWEMFQREKQQIIADKRQLLDGLKRQRTDELARQRQDYASRKEAVRKDKLLRGKQKRDVYRQLSQNHKARSAATFQRHKNALQQIHSQYQVKGWQEWLVDQATAGNTTALAMLRVSVRRPTKGAEQFAFLGNDQGQIFTPLQPSVQANGDVLYTVKGVRIRDTGERLRLDAEKGGDLAAAIRLAREKYGDRLSVDGDEKFKQAVVEAAIASRQAVTFVDPAMEQRRQVLQELGDAKRELRQEQAANQEKQIQSWINKRNETRSKTNDIMQHRRFTASDKGAAIYKGLYKITDSLTIVLYDKSGVLLVTPLTVQQSTRFKHQQVGTPVTLDKRGHVHFLQQERGRGR